MTSTPRARKAASTGGIFLASTPQRSRGVRTPMIVPYVAENDGGFVAAELARNDDFIPNAAALERFHPRSQRQMERVIQGGRAQAWDGRCQQ